MKILFLAANPPGTARLDLDKEVSKIDDGLQRSKLRDQFHLVSKWAVDSNSLRRALLEEKPDIVHFSGHGEGQTGLVLVGQNGEPKPATSEALSGLFKLFPEIKCVVLNACYAETQAKAIVQHIDYVIGMKQSVRDDAAIAFATGFYDGLGYEKSIDVAFELGCNAIQFELASFSSTKRSRKLIPVDLEKVEPLPEHLIPVLLKKDTSSTESSTNPIPSSLDATSLSEKLHTKDDISKTSALSIYRERVQEFLADLKLTQIEKFQLGILANVLGISEDDANKIFVEEQNRIEPLQKPQHNSEETSRSDVVQSKNTNSPKWQLIMLGFGGLVISIASITLIITRSAITNLNKPQPTVTKTPTNIIVDYAILKDYDIRIYFPINRTDLETEANDIKRIFNSPEFKVNVQLNKKDNNFFKTYNYPNINPPVTEIRCLPQNINAANHLKNPKRNIPFKAICSPADWFC